MPPTYQEEYDALNGIRRGRGGVIIDDPTAQRGGKSGLKFPVMTVPAAETPVPARTANAVESARMSNEGGADRGYAPRSTTPDYGPSRSVAVPKRDEAQPYPVNMTNAAGPGERAAVQGYRDIQFNSPPAAVAQGAAQVGSSGLGMLSPRANYQIDDLYNEAAPLLKSRGIVDRLRGRQLMRARSRLLEGENETARTRVLGVGAETGIINANANTLQAQSGAVNANANTLQAQTGAYRATNEVPLALLQSDTQRYGYDSSARTSREGQAVTRYGIDVHSRDSRNATEAGLLPHLPDIARKDYTNRQIFSGDIAGAHETAGIGNRDLPSKLPKMDPAGDGKHVFITHPDGTYETRVIADMVKEAADKAKAAALKKAEDARTK